MTVKRSSIEPTQLDLGFPVVHPAAAVPISRRQSRGAAAGWHGIVVAKLEVDWKLALELAPDGEASKVFVEPRSPAHKAGLRRGDYVVSASPSPVADMPLAQLDALALPAGSEIFVKYHRPQRGSREVWRTFLRLREMPRAPALPEWRKAARVEFGPEVSRDDRKRFLAEMATNPRISQLGYRILGRLVLHYDGPNGIYPKVATIGRDAGVKERATQNQIRRLEWAGVVEVVKFGGVRTSTGRTNRYVLHWPEVATVVAFKRVK